VKVTYEEFAAQFAKMSLDELRAAVLAETGVSLKSKRKIEALEEAYDLYCMEVDASGQYEVPAPRALDVGSFAPSVLPTPEQLAARKAELAEVAEARPVGDLRYEARSRTGRTFHKAGRVFGVAWAPIGVLTASEKAELDKFAAFVQLRVKG
jgi:hypothetical protein